MPLTDQLCVVIEITSNIAAITVKKEVLNSGDDCEGFHILQLNDVALYVQISHIQTTVLSFIYVNKGMCTQLCAPELKFYWFEHEKA